MIQFSGLLGFRASPIFSLSSVEFGVLPMAPRAYWKGFLRLSLVTCPIALFPATSESEKISFLRTSAFIHTGLTRARGSMFTHFTPADLVAILNIPRLQTLPNSFKILREYRLSVVALVFSR